MIKQELKKQSGFQIIKIDLEPIPEKLTIVPAEDGNFKIKEVPWMTGNKYNLQAWIDNPEWYG